MKCLNAALLLMLALGVAAPATAAVQDDSYIQHSDDQFSRLDIDDRIYNEIKNFIQSGMPPASVMLHGVSLGIPIDDVVEMCIRADGSRAQLFYDTAMSLLPALPGWACRASRHDAGRHAPAFDANSLGPNPSVKDVASRFFAGNARLSPFPNWEEGESHMTASTKELVSLLKEQEFWFQPGANRELAETRSFDPKRPIFVSVYKDRKQIVIDSDARVVRAADKAGLKTLPVVFIYNEEFQRPISRFGDDVTLREVADEFFSDGIEVTPVPEWRTGDYHMTADQEEIEELFDIPARDQIDPARWKKLEKELRQDGFEKPLMVTMLRDGEQMWVDEPEKVAVANALGMAKIPLVYYYHGLDRLACGAEATQCQDMICDAAISAGASSAVCQRSSGTRTGSRRSSFGPLGTNKGSMGGAAPPAGPDCLAKGEDCPEVEDIAPSTTPGTPVQPPASSS